MPGWVRPYAALVALLLLWVAPSDARAQRERAQELAGQAREAFEAGNYLEAAALFDEAFGFDPHPVILYNRARCYEELGDLARALELFQRARTLDPSPSVDQELVAKIEALVTQIVERGYRLEEADPAVFSQLATISITSLPEGAEVLVGDDLVGTTPVDDLYIAPGTYSISISKEGYRPHLRSIEVAPGENVSIHAGLRREAAITEYVPPNPATIEVTGPRTGMEVYLDEDRVGSTPLNRAVPPGSYRIRVTHPDFEDWIAFVELDSGVTRSVYADAERVEMDWEEEGWTAREWGFVTLGGAGALLTTGVIFGVIAKADADRYHRNVDAPNRAEIRDSATSAATIADISFAAAGVLAVTAAILVFAGGDRGDEFEDNLVRVDWGPRPDHGWGVQLTAPF